MTLQTHDAIPADPVERALVLAYDEARAARWLADLYPDWQIWPIRAGWLATRRSPVTAAQRAVGVLQSVGRARICELARVLAFMGEKLDAGY